MKEKVLDIGEVARRTGLKVSALRFYEQNGLIESIGREGLRRLFSPNVLVQLEFVALGSHAGFSLKEIGAMMGADGHFKIDRKQLLSKATEVDRSIRHLVAIRDGLRHVAKCGAAHHVECPKFRRLLRVAGKTQARSRRS